MAADPDLTPGSPTLLFEGDYFPSGGWGRNFDVAPDGEGFRMVGPVIPEDAKTELNIVLNWFEELEQVTSQQVP